MNVLIRMQTVCFKRVQHRRQMPFSLIIVSSQSIFIFNICPFQRAKVTDEIPEATEDYSKEFSKLNSKTENDKVRYEHYADVLLKQWKLHKRNWIIGIPAENRICSIHCMASCKLKWSIS